MKSCHLLGRRSAPSSLYNSPSAENIKMAPAIPDQPTQRTQGTQSTEHRLRSDELVHCMVNFYTERHHSQARYIAELQDKLHNICAQYRNLRVRHEAARDAYRFLDMRYDMLAGMYHDLRNNWAEQVLATIPQPYRDQFRGELRTMENEAHPRGTANNPIDLTTEEELSD